MNNKLFLLPIILATLNSCSSTNKIRSPESIIVHTGDTVYLIKPKVIVRKHFGEGVNDYHIDSAENKKAASELAYDIKKLGQHKITIIDLQGNEVQWRDFYRKMNSLLMNNNDSVYQSFKLSDSLHLNFLVNKKKRPVIISYLEWDYDTEDLYQKLYTEYSWPSGRYGRSSGYLVFTKPITVVKLHFILVDPLPGEILSWRFKKYSDTKNKKPNSNMEPVLSNVMMPFLRTVNKKYRKKET
jgi:hypothetical protein